MHITKHISHLVLTAIAAAGALCLCAPRASAQTDPQFSQYYEVPSYYNPAAIGRTDFINIRGGARLQWIGIKNAPRDFVLTGDMPFKFVGKRWGTGLVMSQESIGLFRTLSISAQLAFKYKKWGGEFSFAIAPGMYDQTFKGSETYLPDDDDYHEGSDDAVPTQDLHGTSFDIGAGIWYTHKYWWAGISGLHLTSPTVKLSSDTGDGGASSGGADGTNNFEFHAGRTLYFMGGGNIPVKNTLFEIMPSVLVKTDFTFTTAEITGRVRYNKFLSFGIGYRWNDAITATIAAEFRNFFVGYAYDYAVSDISKASSGSHELIAGYRLKLDLSDRNTHRHKSIRIM